MNDKEKQIEEMAKVNCEKCNFCDDCDKCRFKWHDDCEKIKNATALYNAGYRKITDSVVLSMTEYAKLVSQVIQEFEHEYKDKVVLTKEEYAKLKSLYDSQQGAYMTSSIGDLPLTVEGLRKAVDEIARLIGVQTELQELNANYYNEAKDLRRKLKEAQDFWKATYVTFGK